MSPQRSSARPNLQTSNVVGGAKFVWYFTLTLRISSHLFATNTHFPLYPPSSRRSAFLLKCAALTYICMLTYIHTHTYKYIKNTHTHTYIQYIHIHIYTHLQTQVHTLIYTNLKTRTHYVY